MAEKTTWLKSRWGKISLLLVSIIVAALLHLRVAGLDYCDSYPLLTHISSRLFDLNHIEIRVADNLSDADFKIVNVNSGYVVFENGEYQGGIKNEYGWCLFDVYYQGKLRFRIGHNKFNNWHANHYTFMFKNKTGQMDPTLIIDGPDKNNHNLFYTRFERNGSGAIHRAVFLGNDRTVYRIEDVTQ